MLQPLGRLGPDAGQGGGLDGRTAAGVFDLGGQLVVGQLAVSGPLVGGAKALDVGRVRLHNSQVLQLNRMRGLRGSHRVDYAGRHVVLYFYPKDDTPGCTKEACGFRDLNAEIQGEGARIFGVSADGVESHRAFAEKYGLNFPLLADENTNVAQAYGAWRERTRDGQTSMGMARVTFAIDEEGKVANVWEVSDAESHGQEVLDWLRDR